MRELDSSQLYQECDLSTLDFETTDELAPLTPALGQERALEALRFGAEIRRGGYHIFAIGPAGTGKRTMTETLLREKAASEPPADDWCYVSNFREPHKPVPLRFPAGRARVFQADVRRVVEAIQKELPKAFETEEYRRKRKELEEETFEPHHEALEAIYRKAKGEGLEVMWTPGGVAFRPVANGKPLSREQIEALTEDERKALEARADELQQQILEVLRKTPQAYRRAEERLKEINRETAAEAVGPFVAELLKTYAEYPGVPEHITALRDDLLENVERLMGAGEEEEGGPLSLPNLRSAGRSALLRTYEVNVIVDHGGAKGAPVVYEDNPTYGNVFGRIEYVAYMGALVTDFLLIKAGAMHQANGGYLILDASHVLMKPFVWDALKRALLGNELRIDSPGQEYGLITTVSLQPEPIPLDVKVVLLGDLWHYYIMSEYDSEFAELFKVPADFDVEMDREAKSERVYARFLATLAKREGLRPFDRGAVGRIIEHSARMTGDARKLSVYMRGVLDLLRECDYWAGRSGHSTVQAVDVGEAVEARLRRSNRIQEHVQDAIRRGVLRIDVKGKVVGQINGLSVFFFGETPFGMPVRITARTRMGDGQVVDIEREVELAEASHSKGVLILEGFLTGRYAKDLPLSLSASLVFEQSYEHVSGDSASLAELCALLSSIAEVPIKQSLAITGSVDQRGEAQAIGAVNEKIEGFFDVCKDLGMTGDQGVIIPESNAQHLMLRQDVRKAVDAKTFHIYTVQTADEALELLTGVPAGEPDEEGQYPPDTLNGMISARLQELAAKRQEFLATRDRLEESEP